MDQSWTDKLKQVEIPPPEKGWEGIAASLDESFTGHPFASKLYDHSADVPLANWEKINTALDAEHRPEVVKKPGVVRGLFLRYAVAACAIGLISFAIIKFYPASQPSVQVAVVKPLGPAKDSQTTDVIAPSPNEDLVNDSANKTAEETKQTYASLDPSNHTLATKVNTRPYTSPVALSSSLSSEMALGTNPEIQYPHRAAVNDSPDDNDVNRYLMFKDSEGRFIKISKKLTSLFCCVSGEEHDANCNDQLKSWREKIASSSFIPSPDNFMDILDLVSSLQDSRN